MIGKVCIQPEDPVSLDPGAPDWASASCGNQGRAACVGATGPAGLRGRLSGGGRAFQVTPVCDEVGTTPGAEAARSQGG